MNNIWVASFDIGKKNFSFYVEEFDKDTKEGYQMVLMKGVKALDAGPIDIQIGSYYYFQNKKFIK